MAKQEKSSNISEVKNCFVIMPIGEFESETRKRSDQILRHIITPAAKECGYETVRADQISEPGIITSQVIQHTANDPLVIADLTDRNPNVFYELAIRHVTRKPLIQIIGKGEQIPFDIAGTRIIRVDCHDLDSVEEAKKEMVKQIKAAEKSTSEIDTPISVAIDLQMMKQSDNPEQRSIADLIAAISELQRGLTTIDNRLRNPESLIPLSYLEHLIRRTAPSEPYPSEFVSRLYDIAQNLSESALAEKHDREYAKLKDLMEYLRYLRDRYLHES